MTTAAAWAWLLVAGALDVLWAASMKLSAGYTRLGWTLLSLVALVGFVAILGKVLTVLPIGTSYVVWTGIGATGSVLLGLVLFGETLGPMRMIGILLVVAGTLLLRQSAQ